MESRLILLGFGVLFGALLIVQTLQGNTALALVAVVFTTFGVGGFLWNSTREETIEARFSRSG